MDALEGEWVRGATWYLEKAVEVVASSADPLAAAEKLRQVRPGMASLDFLYLVVKEAAARGVEAAEAARRVSTYVEEVKRRLDAVLAEVECPRRAVTISFSRAVTRLLDRCRGSTERLYLAESRPGRELSEAYATYSRLVETVPIPDSAVGAYDYDVAVAGLDGRYLDYAVNKVGTLPLFAAAKALGAKTVAVFESYKVVPLLAPRPPVVEVELAGRRVEVPLFDRMPPGLVDLAVTDLGVLREVQPRAVFSSVVEKIFI